MVMGERLLIEEARPLALRSSASSSAKAGPSSSSNAASSSSSSKGKAIVPSGDDVVDAGSRKRAKILDDSFLDFLSIPCKLNVQDEGTNAGAQDEGLGGGSGTSAQAQALGFTMAEPLEDGKPVEPDERWVPEPGQIVKYSSSPKLDWVVVSHKQPGAPTPLQEVSPAVSDSLFSEGEEGEELMLLEPPNFEGEEEAEEAAAASAIKVENVLQTFEKVRLRLIRNADAEGRKRGNVPTQAGSMLRNYYVNKKKRIGPVPGVEVGRCFCFRFEMVLVGLHQQIQGGISWMDNEQGVQVATSLVLSGGYEDDVDQGDTFVYIGQGQNRHGKQIGDQSLARGNLALANSCMRNLPVRVIRGFPDSNSPSGKIFSYDGLYKVLRYWPERGSSGYIVYKYFLQREPNQPELTSRLVKFAHKLKSKQGRRNDMVCEDVSGGLELVPIPAVNDVSNPPVAPSGYKYVTKVIFPAWYLKPALPSGCKCKGRCGDPETCKCVRKNGGMLPYSGNGTLLEWKTIIYECGPQCRCPSNCPNRVTQQPRKHRFEVFKTENRGWGVRTWDSIPYGTFICEYVGEMIDNEEAERRVGNDEYIFDIDCIRGSKNRGVDVSAFFEEEEAEGKLSERVEEGMSIDASSCGNFTRFINHSCDPNIFVQCVLYDHNDLKVPHIMMFASRHIHPFEELAYDYGYTIDSVRDPATGEIKRKPCLCGAKCCRKRLY